MKVLDLQRMAAAIACVGLLAPPSFAEVPTDSVADVALRDGGLFVGKVVNAQGAPIAATKVSIQQGGQEIVSTVSDQSGVFAAQGLRGGLYQVVADGGVVTYRLWAPQTAPPAANSSALIVTGDAVLSGQFAPPGQGGIMSWISEHPLLVAGGLAAAIAIPIAVADDDDPAS